LVLPNSKGTEADLRLHYGINRPCRVIYNPIDLAHHKIAMLEPVRDMQFDRFTFVHVGRFEEVKNHLLMLKAVQRLAAHSFQVLLIGYGPLEDKIRHTIKQMNIQDKIVFLGYRDADHVARYIARSQCLVMTSLSEGFPNVLLEALGCGVPAISTDCNSGPREMLCAHWEPTAACNGVELCDYGILVPVNDADALAQAMLMMMENETMRLRYATLATERASFFDMPTIMQQYKAVIAEPVQH
jgi:N-acetylgalactosamine-N,N'-diacetylbacillosaminyl-diphospho-undecaprenol 4-alpha-N-acetylgalactosaminyltransferase